MTYSHPLFRPSGCAAPDQSDLVPPALYRAVASLEACARDLEALLPEDWKGVIESQLDEVRAGIRYVQWKIEDAPALILAERADDYQDDR